MVLSGVLGGLLGAVPKGIELLKAKQDRKKMALEHAQVMELQRLNIEREKAIAEIKGKYQVEAEGIELEREAIFQDAEVQKMNIDSQTKMTLKASPWVLNIVSLFRPFLTLYLMAFLTFIYCKSVLDVRALIATAVIEMAWFSFNFWFMSRSLDKVFKKS